jgi:ATP-dependent Lon protease
MPAGLFPIALFDCKFCLHSVNTSIVCTVSKERMRIMARYIYTEGPTPKELTSLKEEIRRNERPGLFISPNEFIGFRDLLDEDLMADRAELARHIRDWKINKSATENARNEAAAALVAAAADETIRQEAAALAATAAAVKPVEVEPEPVAEDVETDVTVVPDAATISLFSMSTVESLLHTVKEKYRNESSRDQLTSLFKKLITEGPARKLAELPDDWVVGLAKLEQRYPNFSAVIDHVRTECQLADLSVPRAVRLPPFLLAGEPGIGKTAFARDFATMLECGIFFQSLETAQSSAVLCGSSRVWSNTKTGLVFEALIDNAIANPIFLIDELDKSMGDTRFDPIAPFYQLLEQRQAKRFCDESIPDLPIDASHITWIFTANDITKVPAPICNRLVVFHVPKPTATQARHIINTLFDETVVELSQSIQGEESAELLKRLVIPPECVDVLVNESVRQAKIKIRSAVALALSNKYRALHIPRGDDLALMSVVAGDAGSH